MKCICVFVLDACICALYIHPVQLLAFLRSHLLYGTNAFGNKIYLSTSKYIFIFCLYLLQKESALCVHAAVLGCTYTPRSCASRLCRGVRTPQETWLLRVNAFKCIYLFREFILFKCVDCITFLLSNRSIICKCTCRCQWTCACIFRRELCKSLF